MIIVYRAMVPDPDDGRGLNEVALFQSKDHAQHFANLGTIQGATSPGTVVPVTVYATPEEYLCDRTAEAIRTALNKLTPEEREILGFSRQLP